MLFYIFLLVALLTVFECEAYVLLQVRKKDANHSNVDALIHKTVPSKKFDEFAERIGESQMNAERIAPSTDKDSEKKNSPLDITITKKPNVVFSLDHIRDKNSSENYRPVNKALETDEELAEDGLEIPAPGVEREPDLGDVFAMVGRKFARGPSGPMFRSKSEGILFQPEIVQLKSGKSSVYNIYPDNLIIALKELLSSMTLKKYMDKLSRKAAAVFRTVETDLQPIAAKFLHYKDYKDY